MEQGWIYLFTIWHLWEVTEVKGIAPHRGKSDCFRDLLIRPLPKSLFRWKVLFFDDLSTNKYK